MAGEEGNQLFLVFSNPVAGRDDEYNTWYDEVHLGDVRRVPGVVDAKRYELVPTGGEGAPAPAHRTWRSTSSTATVPRCWPS